ncbi:MAG: hypothetical protein WC876_02310 [Candidatus Thermoplasmatota archaeon]|jgi:hypothetical protein
MTETWEERHAKLTSRFANRVPSAGGYTYSTNNSALAREVRELARGQSQS